MNNPLAAGSDGGFGVTDDQREALEEGYFDVPRGITLVGLAEQLGISDSAVSQRIRRGLAGLISATLVRDSTRGD